VIFFELLKLTYEFCGVMYSAAAYEEFALWKAYDDAQDNFCVMNEEDKGSEYVDLLLNPERYTGYKGKSAHRIWNSIYLENCFRYFDLPKHDTVSRQVAKQKNMRFFHIYVFMLRFIMLISPPLSLCVPLPSQEMGWDNVVNIATWRLLRNCGLTVARERDFPVLLSIRTGSQAHPTSCLLASLCLGVNWPGHETYHSLPPCTEVENDWNYTSGPPCACMVGMVTTWPVPYS
jgi:hypothetical protein